MKRRTMTRCMGWGTVLVAGLMAVGSIAAEVDTLPDTWGQEPMGGPEITYGDSGSVTVAFPAQSSSAPPQYRAVLLMANATISGGAFVGDYVSESIRGVSLRVASSQPPCWIELVLQGAESGRLWRNRSVATGTDTGWVTNTISFDRSSGWIRDDEGDLDAMWTQDLHNVAMIGVRLIQSGFDAQTVSVDRFMLRDSSGFVTAAAELTDLQQALLARFGVSDLAALTAEQMAADADGDGMTDVQELMAGTNPDSATSIFAAEVIDDASAEDPGITISWPCVAGARYTVLRATNLTDGFQNLAVGLVATANGTMTYRDTSATDEGAYFYRIRKD